MRGAGQLRFGRVGVEEFGAEFGEVNFLRVGGAFRVYRTEVIRFFKNLMFNPAASHGAPITDTAA